MTEPTDRPGPPAPPAPVEGHKPKRILPFSGWWAVLAGAAAGVLMRVLFSGKPGDVLAPMAGSFIFLVPVFVACVTVYLAERSERRSWGYYIGVGALSNILFVLGTMAIMIEGIICAILIVPLFAVFGGVAGLAMGAVCRVSRWPRQTLAIAAILPFVSAQIEATAPLPQRLSIVERSLIVRAPPARIWKQLENARDIRPQEVDRAWMYRIGAPLPTAGTTQQVDDQHVRHITMGRGVHFEQVATDWQPGRYVRWEYRFSDDSFPPHALDDHVKIGGHYFDLRETEYFLTPVSGGTQLRIRMHYRVSTNFNWYAGPIADVLVGNFADVILAFYANRAQAATSSPS